MCNLYSIKTRRADLARKFRLSDNRMAVFGALPAIFPGGMAPIIKQSADGERELVMRSWGFILLRDGYAPKRVTNTRDDKVQTKFWKNSFVNRRCLVPATIFASQMKARQRGGTGSRSKAMATGRCSASLASIANGTGRSRRTATTSISRCSRS